MSRTFVKLPANFWNPAATRWIEAKNGKEAIAIAAEHRGKIDLLVTIW